MNSARRVFALTALAALITNVAHAQVMDDHANASVYGPAHSKLKFAPCTEDADLECGKLTLPVDHARSSGETLQMAVIRAKVADPSQRIGVLVVNPGGPGGSGVNFLLEQAQTPFVIALRQRFDLISFDVRGSHRSQAINCRMQRTEIPTGLDDAALAIFLDEFSERMARACTGQAQRLATSMSTNNIARDMDALRRALGEKQITFVGVSYGAALGAVYASLFPQHVRGMLLDAAVMPEFRDYFVEYASEQGIAIDLTLQRVDDLCRKDPACALSGVGVMAAFDTVMTRLAEAPVSSNNAVLTDENATFVVHALLHEEFRWPLIVQALSEALAGDHKLFFTLLQSRLSLTPVFPRDSVTAFEAIQCSDFGSRRRAADYLPVAQTFSALSPRFFGRPSISVAAQVAQCAAWPPADAPTIRNVRRSLSSRILMLAADVDPATPLAWTRRLALKLGMEDSLVRYLGGGHVALRQGSPCAQAAAAAYLFELVLPEPGFTCPAQPISFAGGA